MYLGIPEEGKRGIPPRSRSVEFRRNRRLEGRCGWYLGNPRNYTLKNAAVVVVGSCLGINRAWIKQRRRRRLRIQNVHPGTWSGQSRVHAVVRVISSGAEPLACYPSIHPSLNENTIFDGSACSDMVVADFVTRDRP